MKHKVLQLEGALLDAAVEKASGAELTASRPEDAGVSDDGVRQPPPSVMVVIRDPTAFFGMRVRPQPYSSSWESGGPIIEREAITIVCSQTPPEAGSERSWSASVGPFEHYIDDSLPLDGAEGPTPLIAAMRAFVYSRLGEEVDLP